MTDICPFKAGDFVVYSPSYRGYAIEGGERLEVGKVYRVERIEKGYFVVVKGTDIRVEASTGPSLPQLRKHSFVWRVK